MRVKVNIIKWVDIKFLLIDAGVRFWEDGDINGEADSNTEPKMPFAMKEKVPNHNPWKPEMMDGYKWEPMIDIDLGIIVGWPEDIEADIHYKVCDECHIIILDKYCEEIYNKEGYVPQALCIGERGAGDYIIMHIERGGKISNWDPEKVKDIVEINNNYDY